MVKLGEVATQISRAESLLPGQNYRQIGVRLWVEGAYERESIDGSQTKYAQLFRAESGDIIVNKIWARNGSVAVVPKELAGCFGSGEFPMFIPNPTQLEPRWIHWLTKTRNFWTQCDEKSRGTSGKNRIKPEQFLQIEIPLPPLPEQRRIVARIEAVAARIQEAKGLRREVLEEAEILLRSMMENTEITNPTPLKDLLVLRQPDVRVVPEEEYHFAGVYSFGRGVFQGECKTGINFSYPRLTRIHSGDFVYPKLMAWEGAFGIVPSKCENHVVSPEFPVFAINKEKVLPEILEIHFRSPVVWGEISGRSTGTNVRRRRLNPKDFLNYKFPLPSKEGQICISKIYAKVSEFKRLQSEIAAELDALLPAVLDRAFKGKL
jgi:type I restriction enzyme S subunit